MSKISIKNEPKFEKLKAITARMRSARVAVGFPKNSGRYPDGTKVVDVAIFNEFGTQTIPERPFFRTTFTRNKKKYARLSEKLATRLMRGHMSMKFAMEHLGLEAVGDVQENIADMKSPANAPSTIEQKGSSNPLIDTGLMRQSVTHRVIKS